MPASTPIVEPQAPDAGMDSTVEATPAALAMIERLRAMHGPLMFHQSGG
jgi:hypothetical protein